MNMKAVVPLVLAVILGLAAAVLVHNAIAKNSKLPGQPTNLVTVVVAKQNIDPGQELGKDDLLTSKVPADSAPGQVFSDTSQLIGRVPTVPLLKDQAILETLLAPNGTGSGLQALVPVGMRAFTVDINEVTGVGGMLVPGCHVDVLTAVHDSKTNENFTRTILQNLKVTAVGRTVSNVPANNADGQGPPPPANNITLLCTPHQAQVMELACISGKPWFVLRSTRDGQELSLDGTTLAELRGDDTSNEPTISVMPAQAMGTNPMPSENQPATIKHVVQILRGGAESQVTFVMPNPRSQTADVSDPATDAH